MPSPENDSLTVEKKEPLHEQVGSLTKTVTESEKLDVHVSSDRIPQLLIAALENLAKPQPRSRLSTTLKEHLPALTPVAAVVVSVAVAYSTYQFNERTAVAASADTLGKLIEEFGEGTGTNKETNPESDYKMSIAAMKIAVHGDQALPAVKVALGAEDANLRNGAVLVAKQMYRAETIAHERLTKEMLGYYDNPALRRGVLEWLEKMDTGILESDSRLALNKLKQSFGASGEFCSKQDSEVAQDAAGFLQIQHFADSKDIALGLVENCPASFNGAREQAVTALQEIARSLSQEERNSIRKRLENLLPQSSPQLAATINNSIFEIQKMH